MNNDPFIVNDIWKQYDVVMFSSKYKKVTYNNSITGVQNNVGILPNFHITLRNKKHPELIIRTRTRGGDNDGVYEVLNKDGNISYYINTANYTWELFDVNHKCWHEFGVYNYPTVTMNKITEIYFQKQTEFKRKFHQKATHPRVVAALKDFMDEYIINEITKDLFTSIEMICGYDL